MNRRLRQCLPAGAVVLVVTLSLVGCGSKITREHFEKIQPGMSQEEVKAILGEPTESSGATLGPISAGLWVWKQDGAAITIQFVGGKVMAKHFEQRPS